MIVKSFELNKLNLENDFFLLYGENEGFKNEVIKNNFERKLPGKIIRYEEKEILNNINNFYNNIFTKSFFDNEKVIIISRISDKIINIIEEIMERNLSEIKIILNGNNLDKRSKLRSLFEKNKKLVCIPFYSDNNQTLMQITNLFFNQKKISISNETINLLVDRSRGDRNNLRNELDKIENYLITKKNITINEIIKLTNLAENYSISELVDNCLAKNQKKTINILNENNFLMEDCIIIIRSFLLKTKRLLKLVKAYENNKNLEAVIASYKPPIFWKEKDIVKKTS